MSKERDVNKKHKVIIDGSGVAVNEANVIRFHFIHHHWYYSSQQGGAPDIYVNVEDIADDEV